MFKGIWHRKKQPQVKELVAEASDLTKLGRYEEALALYERARQLTSDPGILKLIALTLGMMKRPAEALAACDTALARNPQDGALWGLKGTELVKLKRYA
ncbi:MAG: tetratricopeptide repeat protein [Ktedonobacterales bacterium]